MDNKGIDMVFKGAQKKYPFLVDWFVDSDVDNYMSLVPINLIINKEMTCKHFGYEQRKEFLKRFTNFGWVMDCDVMRGDEIYLELYRYFVNGYEMIPPEFCKLSSISFDGGIKRLSVSLIYLDDYVSPEPDSFHS